MAGVSWWLGTKKRPIGFTANDLIDFQGWLDSLPDTEERSN